MAKSWMVDSKDTLGLSEFRLCSVDTIVPSLYYFQAGLKFSQSLSSLSQKELYGVLKLKCQEKWWDDLLMDTFNPFGTQLLNNGQDRLTVLAHSSLENELH